MTIQRNSRTHVRTIALIGLVMAAAAVPAWRTILHATFRAPAIAMEQDAGQWTPFAAAPNWTTPR